MKKTLTWFSFILLVCISNTALCQEIIDTPIEHDIGIKDPKVIPTAVINGRVLGVNLENVEGATVTNSRTAEKVYTDSRGIFQINAAKGDMLTFNIAKYSKEIRVIKNFKENLNVIMIKRKADELPPNPEPSDLRKAERADASLYNILEKDAKIEGKWNY